jgi:LysR family transcriptional activator of mexEF-oprN operon
MGNVFGTNANQLVALAALLQHRSVTAAAKEVGVTQSAMSGTLAQLRELLGDPLLVRVGRTMQPTPRALALVDPLRRAIGALEEVLVAPRAFDPATSEQRFAIALDDRADLIVVPELLRRVRAEAPGVTLQVRAWGRHDAPPELATGELDLAVGVFTPGTGVVARAPRSVANSEADASGDARGHLLQPLFDVGLVTLARRRHPLVGRTLDLDTFCAIDHVLVTDEPWATGVVDAALARLKRRRNIALRVPRHLSVGWAVAASDLVATIDDRVARLLAVSHGLQTFDPPVPIRPVPLAMLWHARTDRDPARQWLRERIAGAAVGCGAATALPSARTRARAPRGN